MQVELIRDDIELGKKVLEATMSRRERGARRWRLCTDLKEKRAGVAIGWRNDRLPGKAQLMETDWAGIGKRNALG